MTSPGAMPQTVCARHPDRPTGLTCNRCGRPACPDCLREAAVGYQCVDCVRAGRDDVRQAGAAKRPAPYVTYALIALNVVVFAITAVQSSSVASNDLRSSLFASWALRPFGVADGQWIRVLGSAFLHYGPVHIAVNMLALYVVGRDVEVVLGRSRYLGIYVVSILGGAAAVMVGQPWNSETAGASGAIFGLFGALAVVLVRLRQSPGPVLVIIAINIVISVTLPGVSLWGHLGGLAAGTVAAIGLLFVPAWLRIGMADSRARVVGWIAVVFVAVVAIALIAVRAGQIRTELGIG